jgi:predicted porin
MTTSIIRRGVARGVFCWLAVVAFTVAAHAADADLVLKAPVLKDPLPDKLTWNGITLFGQVDVGYGYNSQGAPINPNFGEMNSNVWASGAGYKPISSLQNGGMAFPFIGLKIEENIGNGWQAIGQLDTGFNPLSGQLDNACASIVENNGKPGNQQNVWFNSSRCGQVINGQAFAGVRNATYGTLTFGRQSPLDLTTLSGYDPTPSSVAFSLLGWSSGWGGAVGAADANKWDNAVKYTNQYGPVHGGLMYSEGSEDSGLHGQSYGVNVGATWQGFSVDAVYTLARDELATTTYGVGGCGTVGTPSCSTLAATATNNTGWTIMGKYTYDLGGASKGLTSTDKLTFYAGYQDDRFSNPSDPVSVGDTVNGGYVLGSVNNTAYNFGNKHRDIAWIGTKYETGPWTYTAAYYLGYQPYYRKTATAVPCSSSTFSYCSGTLQLVSATVDYAFNKHLDAYAGVVWSGAAGGLSNGYTTATAGYPTTPYVTSFLTGLVLRF